MPSNIEQAISSVLLKHESLTVANVLVAYLKLLGYMPPDGKLQSVPHDALVAFEHALDKEPALRTPRRVLAPKAAVSCPGLRTRMYTKEITELRREYWKGRLAAPASQRCTCPTCGCTVGFDKNLPEDIAAEERPVARRLKDERKKTAKARRVVNRLRDTVPGVVPFDPYGPSTSALVI